MLSNISLLLFVGISFIGTVVLIRYARNVDYKDFAKPKSGSTPNSNSWNLHGLSLNPLLKKKFKKIAQKKDKKLRKENKKFRC